MRLKVSFKAEIQKGEGKGGWTYVLWPESAEVLGTRRSVKVKGSIDGHTFQATFMPWGDGTHMLPLRSATMEVINKQPGDLIEVQLEEKI